MYIDSAWLNDGLAYDFSTLWYCKSDMHSVETVFHILSFAFFPG